MMMLELDTNNVYDVQRMCVIIEWMWASNKVIDVCYTVTWHDCFSFRFCLFICLFLFFLLALPLSLSNRRPSRPLSLLFRRVWKHDESLPNISGHTFKRIKIMSHYSIGNVRNLIRLLSYCAVYRRGRVRGRGSRLLVCACVIESVLAVYHARCVKFTDWMGSWFMSSFKYIYFVNDFCCCLLFSFVCVFICDIYLELNKKPHFSGQHVWNKLNRMCFKIYNRKQTTTEKNTAKWSHIHIWKNVYNMRHVFISCTQ